jgi:outer membrane protein insertion porin family
MRRMMTAIICLLIAAGVAMAAEAQKTVRQIEIKNIGVGQVDEKFVLAHISVKKDSELDGNAVAKDIKALLATGHFTNVRVDEDSLDDGIRLIYCVEGRLRLTAEPEIKGVDNLGESKVRGVIELVTGDMVDEQALNMKARKVEEEYRKEHYPNASVSTKLEIIDKERGLAKATFIVAEGKLANVRKVIFAGNKVMSTDDLMGVMNPAIWWKPWSWFGYMRYDSEELETARMEITAMYLDKGYLDAEVAIPVVETAPDGGLTISVNIHEGVYYRFGKVTLAGITLFPESELRKIVKDRIKAGEIATPMMIEMASQALRDYYGSRGYINTSVRAVRNPVIKAGEASATLDLQFVFMEGKLVGIRNILIRGNSRTKDKVIRRELQVYPGDVFNEVKIRNSQEILMNLGYFSDVRAEPLPTRDAAVDDLVFDVEEKQTGMFNAGVGFSSIDKFEGFIGISQANFDLMGWPNFTGGGQKLKLSATMGQVSQDYRLSFEEPWFMDQKLAFGLDLYKTDTSYDDYEDDRTGGSISLRRALPGANGANSVAVRYQLERVVIRNIADSNEYFYVEPFTTDITTNSYYLTSEEGDRIESSLTLTFTHDTRDNPFIPRRGMRASLFGSITGGPLGFDTDIYRLGFNGSQYFPLWFKHVFSLRAQCEIVDCYGSTDVVPLGDRLYMGGPRTLRGYDYRDVGPKVASIYTTNNVVLTGHLPVGGGSSAMASAEYTIPLAKVLRFACFYDIGNVWKDPYDFDLRHMASSAGMGIRLDLPMFPIRIDRAWSIRKDDRLTGEQAWVFWIGPVN